MQKNIGYDNRLLRSVEPLKAIDKKRYLDTY